MQKPAQSDSAKSVAKVAIAGIFGGRLGVLAALGDQVLDVLLSSSDGHKSLDDVIGRVADNISSYVTSEGISPEVLGRAVTQAKEVFARFPPTASEFARADFDPAKLLTATQFKASAYLSDLDEEDREVCRLLLRATIDALANLQGSLPEVQHEFQRLVMSRINSLEGATHDVAVAVRRLSALALISDPLRHWDPALFPMSALLRAQYAVVPFFGRDDELHDLNEWAGSPVRVALRLITGAGGLGKSRLLIELCERLRGRGWECGFIPTSTDHVTEDTLKDLAADGASLLLIVDYAETRRPLVARLLEASLNTSATVRVILVARNAGEWWGTLTDQPGIVGDFFNGPAVDSRPLGPIAATQEARADVYGLAVHAFARALQHEERDPTERGDLQSDLYDRVLFLHLAALNRLLGEEGDSESALLDFVLRREQGFLDTALATEGLPHLRGQAIRQALALLTLSGGAVSAEDAQELIRRAPLLEHEDPSTLARLAQLLRVFYPSDGWLAGLEPDILGEHLVARAVEQDPSLLDKFSASAGPQS